MLRLAADENFNNDILRGVLRRNASTDIVHIQDVGLSGADDPTVLEWAAQTGSAAHARRSHHNALRLRARSGREADAGRLRGWS